MRDICAKFLAIAFVVAAPLRSVLWAEQAIILPSGQDVVFFEQRDEPEAGIMRLRFIAPDLASPLKRPSFEDMSLDLEALCNAFGVQALLKSTPQPMQIIISLSAEPVEFGLAAPEVEQVFEAFRVENGTCMWEMF